MKTAFSFLRRTPLHAAAAILLSGLAASHARAQAVWTNADDRNYNGNPPVFAGAFWSYGYVAPDANGNGGHAGNWSGSPIPGIDMNGHFSGPVDVYLGAPGDTLCNVRVTLNSLTFAPGGALNLDYGSALTVTTTTLATDGTMTQGGGGGGFPPYTNTGTLTKTAGTGTFAFAGDITLNSTPGTTIAVNSGTLQLPGSNGLLDTVTFDPAAGTLIDLVSQGATSTFVNHFQGTLTNGAGTGTVRLSQGTMSGTQRFLADADVTACMLAFTGNVFQWTGGVIGDYQQGATFTNTGVVNVVGDNTPTLFATFTNAGTLIQTGAGGLTLGTNNSGGSLTNAATGVIDLQSDAGIGYGGGNSNFFTNLGLLKKSGGTGTSTITPTLTFNNQGGTVEADSGAIQLSNTGTNTGGTYRPVAAGTLIDLGAGTFTGTYTGTGAGTVRFSAGTLTADKPTATVFNFPGDLFQWTGGILGTGQGGNVFTNVGTINLSGDATKSNTTTFTNQGTVNQTGAGDFSVGTYHDGGSFTNAAGAVYDLQSDAGLTTDFGNNFNNAGVFKKSGGAGTSTLAVAFNNQGGTVEADSGTLLIAGTQYATGTNTGGTYNPTVAGALIDLGSGAFSGTYTGSGAGIVRLSSSLNTVAPGATFSFPGALFQWTGGSINGGSDAPFANAGTMNLSGNTDKANYAPFTNNGTMVQTGTGNFSVGTYHGGGSFTNAAGAVYDLQSDAGLTTDFGNTFTNAGLFKKSGGAGTSTISALTTNTGTVSVYTGTLLFSAQYNNGVADVSGTTLTEGTWNVFDGATLTFASYGALTINQADVTLSGPGSQFTSFNSLSDNQGTFSLLALRQFTTAGDLSNEGTIFLDAGSTLHVTGNFTATAGAAPSSASSVHTQAAAPAAPTLHVVVGGTAAQGAQSPGILQVGGTAKLTGLLEIALADLAATPGNGDSVTILAAKSVGGSFDNAPSGTRVTTKDGRGSFMVTYTASSVGLSHFQAAGQIGSTPPVVTIAALGDAEAVEGGENGKVAIRRAGDLTNALVVRYKVAGGVVAGKDYKTLPGVATIPAGAAQVKVKIKPINDTAHEGTRVAKVKLKAATDGSYTLGSPAAAKVRIIDNE